MYFGDRVVVYAEELNEECEWKRGIEECLQIWILSNCFNGGVDYCHGEDLEVSDWGRNLFLK